jgi:nicotinamidase-related amidase
MRMELPNLRTIAAGMVLTASLLAAVPAGAATIIDEWQGIVVPPAPELKPVTVDVTTTALLLLDFSGAQDPSKGPCNVKKPRCIASLPKMGALLAAARKANMLVVYSVAGSATAADIATAVAPLSGDPVVKSGPDKFLNTDLGKLLGDKGIMTVIVTGTAAEGAVLDTATDAALHGMNVIIPVDGMSSTNPYAEQYVAWHFANAPGVSRQTTLTDSTMIGF